MTDDAGTTRPDHREPDGATVARREPDGAIADRREPALTLTERVFEAVDRRLPYLFLVPALALVASLVVYPVVRAVELSLHEVVLINLSDQQFVGVSNYATVVSDPVFATVMRNTVVFVGASVLGQVAVGLGLALLLERRWLGGRLTRLFRLAFVLPWATTGVIVAFSWQFMFHPRMGIVNETLRALGVATPPTWLNSTRWAMAAVIVATVWRGVPFSLIFQTSGLQSIPSRLYEAADVGGASPVQTVRHVTVPLLWPFVAMNLVLVTLFTVNVFDIVFVMTGGGPLHATEVLSLYMYETAFDVGAFGRANAVAVILFGLNVAVVALYLVAFDRGNGGAR
ncbi:sugar ABC transporter permease [Halostella sp. PRR32]|uniref:carbohydrate ABC transporter permease n=1 Tax=Halostella sp. PRR32 TaxID=3098147 RepID=UPI002B1D3230|nr:sugar ABC transporter permease [Halostella sp. PRR32]